MTASSSTTRRPSSSTPDPRLLWDHENCILHPIGGVVAVAKRLEALGRWPPENCPAFTFPPSNIVRWVQHLRLEHEANMDNVVLIDGRERVGKSTLGILIAWLFDGTFKLEKDVAFYTVEELLRLLDDPTWYKAVLADEAIAYLFNRKAGGPEAIEAITRLYLCGKNRKLILVLTPNAASIDPVIRRHRAAWWWYVSARGQAELHAAFKRKIYTKRGEILEPGTVTVWRSVFGAGFSRLPLNPLKKYEAIKADRYKSEVIRQVDHLADLDAEENPFLPLDLDEPRRPELPQR